MRYKTKLLAVLVLAVGALAFTSYVPSVADVGGVVSLGQFVTERVSASDTATLQPAGGVAEAYKAGDSARMGRVMYFSAANEVKSSVTLANYNTLAGVVCGGARTSMKCLRNLTDTSTLVATSGQKVLLIVRGRYYVLLDTASGISPGTAIIPGSCSTCAGRARGRTTALDTFYRVFGKILDTGVTNKAVLADIRVR